MAIYLPIRGQKTMFKETMMPKMEGGEKEKEDKKEKSQESESKVEKYSEEIKNLASEIKGLYEKIDDKVLLDKYLDRKDVMYGESLHRYIYDAFSGTGTFSKEKQYSNSAEEANALLANISGEQIIEWIKKSPDISGSLEGRLSFQIGNMKTLKTLLDSIVKMEGKAEATHSFDKIPEELRPAMYMWETHLMLGGREYDFECEDVKMDETEAEIKIRGIDKEDPSIKIRPTIYLKKTERGWERYYKDNV